MTYTREINPETFNRRWLIAVVVLMGTWAGTFGNSTMAVALPSMINDFNVTKDVGVWIISIYTLLVGVLMPLYGWMGDRYGYKRIYTVGLLGLWIFSWTAALSPSFEWMMASRVMQGIFNATTLVSVMAIISEVFPREERGAAMGLWATVNGAAHGTGPIISGFLVEHFSWHVIFWLNGFTGLIAAAMVFFLAPSDHRDIKRRFDMIGAVSFTVSMLILMFVLSRGSDLGWASPLVLGLITLLIGLATAFFMTERQVEKPFIQLSLFSNRKYVILVLVNGAQFFCLNGLPVLLAFFLIEVQDRASDVAGLLVAPLAISLALSSSFGGRIADRIGFRKSMMIGLPVVALAAISMTFWQEDASAVLLVLTLAITGVGLGLSQSPAASGVTLVIPAEQLGIALGVFNMFRFVAGTLSVTTFGLILDQADSSGMDLLGAIHVGFYLVAGIAVLAVALAFMMPRPVEIQATTVTAQQST